MFIRHANQIQKVLPIALLAAVVACAGDEPQTTEAETHVTDEQVADASLEEIGEEMADVAQATEAYAYSQKEDFETLAEEQLAAFDAQLDELEERVAASDEAVREQWQTTLEGMRALREDLNAKLAAAMTSSEDAWDEMRSGFSEARDTLGQSIEDAWQELVANDESEAS